MENKKRSIASDLRSSVTVIGEITHFAYIFFTRVFKPPLEIKETLRQMYLVGYKTLLLVSATIFIIGLVITIQLTPRMEDFGAAELVPNMIAIAFIREVGPVLTALVCAGKIGSGIGAEIGSMKISEQIDSMAVSGVDPYRYLVVTRVLATSFVLPILSVYSFVIGLLSSFLAYNLERSMSISLFFQVSFTNMGIHDVIPSIIKSILFGFSIAIIGCFFGYRSQKGANGVGKSANVAVVSSFYVIFFIDMIAAQVVHIISD